MRGKTELGPSMVLLVATLAARGPMEAKDAADATGLSYHTARQYLRRLAFRGAVVADRSKKNPIYRVAPGWKVSLAQVDPVAAVRARKPEQEAETTVTKAIARAPALHTIWMN